MVEKECTDAPFPHEIRTRQQRLASMVLSVDSRFIHVGQLSDLYIGSFSGMFVSQSGSTGAIILLWPLETILQKSAERIRKL